MDNIKDQLEELQKDFEEFKKDKEKELDKLKTDIRLLTERRINQTMILPDAIKMRAIGEGVRFIRSGLAADRPTSGEDTLQGSALYWATDTFVLSIWTGSVWKDETFT